MPNLILLQQKLKGQVLTDAISLKIYSTDASAYQELPMAVIIPKDYDDLKQIISFANEHKLPIIPRAAGTSLAGQVVGSGIVVDISKHFDEIIEVNKNEGWVRLQPGVNLTELNNYLTDYDLFFGPETSTANRCKIGGMVGNNSCGLHSLIYGSTRDHTLEIKALLSDGSDVTFKALNKDEFVEKCQGNSLENKIYKQISELLNDKENQQSIAEEYPKASIPRRNTGYALDLLLKTEPFMAAGDKFNFCKLIAGSEGTLTFIYEIKLNLVPPPPKEKAVVAIHLNDLMQAFHANLIALNYQPGAIELMDKIVLDCTKTNIEQQKNRFFIKGEPEALLIVEFARQTKEEINNLTAEMETEMRKNNYGYHFPVLWNKDTVKVWNLRKAGLGVLSNIPGDGKPVSVIEDTAVDVHDMPDYIDDFRKILTEKNLECVFHAHIATGELHLRPVIDLKQPQGQKQFREIATEIAHLVKKYKGSLSGEHGDGRLRGEFIPIILGQKNYELLKQVKKTWDPDNLFNPQKIVDTPPMDKFLRFDGKTMTPKIKTIFDFSESAGILRMTEKCNGTGDCLKSSKIGGTMCPTFMATKDEKYSTRARANMLRQILTGNQAADKFNHKELFEVLDYCISCKACKAECPSNIDMAKLKAEFLQHYYDNNTIPLRTKIIANINFINNLSRLVSSKFVNNFQQKKRIKKRLEKIGFAPQRNLPQLSSKTLGKWYKKQKINSQKTIKTVYLFNDEFTNHQDTDIGIKCILLLQKLNYQVIIPKHVESGRAYISKGFLRKARKIAYLNCLHLGDLINEEAPLVGIEPSAILSFRDEYPDLLRNCVETEIYKKMERIAQNTFMIDEFLSGEMENGNIKKEQFTNAGLKIKLHGHCQQKAIASTDPTLKILSFPENYQVEEISSGCCGMAGSFGYEAEHYELSMKIGELVLFPEIRKTDEKTVIAATGTSCRHQIKDGTKRTALHPVEILFQASKK